MEHIQSMNRNNLDEESIWKLPVEKGTKSYASGSIPLEAFAAFAANGKEGQFIFEGLKVYCRSRQFLCK